MKISIKNFIDFTRQDFPILDDNKSKWILILFCAFFATLFLIIYNPLNVIGFKINTQLGNLLSIKSAGVIGALVLIITQFYLRPIVGVRRHSILSFSLWLLLELSILSMVFYVIYGERGQPFWHELYLTVESTVMLAIFPYSIGCILIALYRTKRNKQQDQKPAILEFVTLQDENGKDVLTVRSSDLIYLKAEDNYVQVTYLQNGSIEKKLIRNNLKTLEINLNNPNLIRIHRSYMINRPNINSIDREGRKIVVQMNYVQDTRLPVSSSYKPMLESSISNLTA